MIILHVKYTTKVRTFQFITQIVNNNVANGLKHSIHLNKCKYPVKYEYTGKDFLDPKNET